jgi:hypothetical protein
MECRIGPGFDAAVIAIDRLMAADLGIFEAVGLLLGGKNLHILAKGALIAFESEDVISLLVHDFLRNLALAANRLDGDDGALDCHHVEECRNGDDLVGLFRDFDLSEHEALTRRKCRHHVDRGFGASLLVGAAQRLAIDGNHIGRRAGQRSHPGHEALLELVGVESGKNVAELIVRGRTVAKRPKPAQKAEFLLAKQGNIDERFRSAQYREQT